MLIPIGTEVRPRKPPLGNYILIAVNVLVFVFTDLLGGAGGQHVKTLWSLYAAVPDLGQYITYQFLHGGWLHLAGNMLFLWIFGNAVCDRMGSLCYAMFYLAGGVFAGFVFSANSHSALVGASGSIAAVTTAFLVLFPRVRITMLLWFFLITTFRVPAMILIVFKIILWDNLIAPGLDRSAVLNVAYSAHLGGYAFGFALAMSMLALRALPRTQFDLLALWARRRRRSQFATLSRYPNARPIAVKEVGSRPLEALPLTPAERLREAILERLAEHDPAGAADGYRQLRRLDPDQVLPHQAQLDVANYLAQAQRHSEAAAAYESFLSAYPGSPDVHQVRLLLGLIYGRHLQRFDQAATYLRHALEGLRLPAQRALAEQELRVVEARRSERSPGDG